MFLFGRTENISAQHRFFVFKKNISHPFFKCLLIVIFVPMNTIFVLLYFLEWAMKPIYK